MSYNWIPTFVNLASKGIDIVGLCLLCKCKPDSSFHALCGCALLEEIRSGVAVWLPPPLGCCKLNINASLSPAGGLVGLGLVV
ncbi:hypothetical protein ACOSQ3_006944 [Xanthoceras sorbifolium]